MVAHKLFALQLHPGTINDEPIVPRTLTSIVEDNVCARVHSFYIVVVWESGGEKRSEGGGGSGNGSGSVR